MKYYNKYLKFKVRINFLTFSFYDNSYNLESNVKYYYDVIKKYLNLLFSPFKVDKNKKIYTVRLKLVELYCIVYL